MNMEIMMFRKTIVILLQARFLIELEIVIK